MDAGRRGLRGAPRRAGRGRVGGVPRVFVTRSPCVRATDGRLVPVVTRKPAGMSEAAWASLRGRPFGEIVFSNRLDSLSCQLRIRGWVYNTIFKGIFFTFVKLQVHVKFFLVVLYTFQVFHILHLLVLDHTPFFPHYFLHIFFFLFQFL